MICSFTESFVYLPCSASDFNDEKQFSEFWNRDDEASVSDEDISDSDGISKLRTGFCGYKKHSIVNLLAIPQCGLLCLFSSFSTFLSVDLLIFDSRSF